MAEWLIALCGLWHLGLGLYFMLLRPALLPEDLRYLGMTREALSRAVPALEPWLGHVFTVMGGFMAAAGVLVAWCGWRVMPLRLPGTLAMLGLAGTLSLVLMSAENFALRSDFRWLLVVPPVGWFLALLLYIRRT